MPTYTFAVRKGEAAYTCKCGECGKTMRRKAVEECTVNPFNVGDDGRPLSSLEVSRQAHAKAVAKAAELEGSTDTCRDCAERPARELLVAMAADPAKVAPAPEKFWGSPMHALLDRKQVEHAYTKCECGAPCCSGWADQKGFRITAAGQKRAAQFTAANPATSDLSGCEGYGSPRTATLPGMKTNVQV